MTKLEKREESAEGVQERAIGYSNGRHQTERPGERKRIFEICANPLQKLRECDRILYVAALI